MENSNLPLPMKKEHHLLVHQKLQPRLLPFEMTEYAIKQ
jgi:hypothetical protein